MIFWDVPRKLWKRKNSTTRLETILKRDDLQQDTSIVVLNLGAGDDREKKMFAAKNLKSYNITSGPIGKTRAVLEL